MNYDGIVIGYGQGAHSIATQLASNGWKIALIEKNETNYGGSCINIGCIPTKVLEHDARAGRDYKDAVKRRNEIVKKNRQSEKKEIEENVSIDLYTGTASFLDNHRVHVALENETIELTSENIFISTGSEPVFPPIEGLEEAEHIYTSTTLQTEKHLPATLGIIGGGNIGLEFASIYSNFGSEATLFEASDTFMEKEEPEVSQAVKEVLEEKGVTIQTGAQLEKVSNLDGKVLVNTNNGKAYHFDGLLIAAGRKPHTDSLNLKTTSIALNDNQGIKVDNHLQTSVEGVYALGDVKGAEQFTYITKKDAEVVLDSILGEGNHTLDDRKAIPSVIFIDPPFARVGLTEKEAKANGYKVKTNTVPVSSTARSQIINDKRGLYKAVVDDETQRILGVTLFGDQAHELVNIVKLTMDQNMSYTILNQQMLTHPVMTEIFNTLFNF